MSGSRPPPSFHTVAPAGHDRPPPTTNARSASGRNRGRGRGHARSQGRGRGQAQTSVQAGDPFGLNSEFITVNTLLTRINTPGDPLGMALPDDFLDHGLGRDLGSRSHQPSTPAAPQTETGGARGSATPSSNPQQGSRPSGAQSRPQSQRVTFREVPAMRSAGGDSGVGGTRNDNLRGDNEGNGSTVLPVADQPITQAQTRTTMNMGSQANTDTMQFQNEDNEVEEPHADVQPDAPRRRREVADMPGATRAAFAPNEPAEADNGNSDDPQEDGFGAAGMGDPNAGGGGMAGNPLFGGMPAAQGFGRGEGGLGGGMGAPGMMGQGMMPGMMGGGGGGFNAPNGSLPIMGRSFPGPLARGRPLRPFQGFAGGGLVTNRTGMFPGATTRGRLPNFVQAPNLNAPLMLNPNAELVYCQKGRHKFMTDPAYELPDMEGWALAQAFGVPVQQIWQWCAEELILFEQRAKAPHLCLENLYMEWEDADVDKMRDAWSVQANFVAQVYDNVKLLEAKLKSMMERRGFGPGFSRDGRGMPETSYALRLRCVRCVYWPSPCLSCVRRWMAFLMANGA